VTKLKKIAVYGSYVAKVPVKQRYWKKRKDGIRQRYWKITKRTKKVVMSGRYEFSGKGKDLYKAILMALNVVPKGFVDVSAEMFLRDPLRYGFEGKWIDRTVTSG
jgi:hypothetical protein